MGVSCTGFEEPAAVALAVRVIVKVPEGVWNLQLALATGLFV